MAFTEASSPSNSEAVMTSLNTFATANGWTQEHFVTAGASVLGRGVLTLSRGDTVVTFRWSGTDTPESIAMYHALAYPGGLTATEQEQPWNFATDSGNGTSSASALSTGRRVSRIGSGPYVRLTMFSGATAGYVLCVLEYATGKYRHFGFGDVLENKIGNWTGGGWVGGHVWSTAGTGESNPVSTTHTVLIDGLGNSTASERGTVHIRGLEGQTTAQRFGVGQNSTGDVSGTDGAGNLRNGILGGIRATMFDRSFLQFIPDPLSGVIELTPALLFYKQRGQRRYQALGFLPGVRMVQLRSFDVGSEVTVGSDTWKFFPVTAKSNIGGNNEESENMGLAYLKVV